MRVMPPLASAILLMVPKMYPSGMIIITRNMTNETRLPTVIIPFATLTPPTPRTTRNVICMATAEMGVMRATSRATPIPLSHALSTFCCSRLNWCPAAFSVRTSEEASNTLDTSELSSPTACCICALDFSTLEVAIVTDTTASRDMTAEIASSRGSMKNIPITAPMSVKTPTNDCTNPSVRQRRSSIVSLMTRERMSPLVYFSKASRGMRSIFRTSCVRASRATDSATF